MMEREPFVTIGIASYNYAQYLYDAFEAIKDQSFRDFELLYADDGSTDDSVSIIETFICDNPDMDIRIIKGNNVGVMGNKQRIIDNARGKYIMLCDADDKMLPGCLEKLCDIAQRTHADQVVGAFVQMDTNNRILQAQEIPSNLSRWTWGTHHATIYNMEIIRNNALTFKNEFYPDDMYFNMIFHDCSQSIQTTNEIIYVWNMHSDSTSASSKVGEENKWYGYPMLKSALSYICPIHERYTGDESQEIEYAAIKMYCLDVLYCKNVRLSKYLNEYKRMRHFMKLKLPNYQNNSFARAFDGKKTVRRFTARAIWGIVFAERMHLIFPVLIGRWVLAQLIDVPV